MRFSPSHSVLPSPRLSTITFTKKKNRSRHLLATLSSSTFAAHSKRQVHNRLTSPCKSSSVVSVSAVSSSQHRPMQRTPSSLRPPIFLQMSSSTAVCASHFPLFSSSLLALSLLHQKAKIVKEERERGRLFLLYYPPPALAYIEPPNRTDGPDRWTVTGCNFLPPTEGILSFFLPWPSCL